MNRQLWNGFDSSMPAVPMQGQRHRPHTHPRGKLFQEPFRRDFAVIWPSGSYCLAPTLPAKTPVGGDRETSDASHAEAASAPQVRPRTPIVGPPATRTASRIATIPNAVMRGNCGKMRISAGAPTAFRPRRRKASGFVKICPPVLPMNLLARPQQLTRLKRPEPFRRNCG
jgi:hypothetical protein